MFFTLHTLSSQLACEQTGVFGCIYALKYTPQRQDLVFTFICNKLPIHLLRTISTAFVEDIPSEEGGNIKGAHGFVCAQSEVLDFAGEVCGFVDGVASVAHDWGQNGCKVFGHIEGSQVNAPDNGSEWDAVFV